MSVVPLLRSLAALVRIVAIDMSLLPELAPCGSLGQVTGFGLFGSLTGACVGIRFHRKQRGTVRFYIGLLIPTLSSRGRGIAEVGSLSSSGAADEVSVKSRYDCGRGEEAAVFYSPNDFVTFFKIVLDRIRQKGF